MWQMTKYKDSIKEQNFIFWFLVFGALHWLTLNWNMYHSWFYGIWYLLNCNSSYLVTHTVKYWNLLSYSLIIDGHFIKKHTILIFTTLVVAKTCRHKNLWYNLLHLILQLIWWRVENKLINIQNKIPNWK